MNKRAIIERQREIERDQIIRKVENIRARTARNIEGTFDVIVVDPPWQIKKIERDITPRQVEWDYPVMTLKEIKSLEIPCADNCHIWLWTT